MDSDAERKKLEDERAWIQGYIAHPITQNVRRDNLEGQEALVNLICQNPITSLETFFAHFEAVGHLRGLRRSQAIVESMLAEIEEQLKEIEPV